LWPFRSKSKAEKPVKNIRIDAEDLIEQNYTCAEIAEELGITQEEVYRIKQAKGRRDARMSGKSEQDTEREDKIATLKEELAAVELQDKIDEAKHKAFLRQQERDDIEQENASETIEEASESPDKLLQTLFASIALKQLQGQQAQNLNNPIPTQAAAVSQTAAVLSGNESRKSPTESALSNDSPRPPLSAAVNFQQIEAGIKTGLLSEERFLKETETLGLQSEKAKKLYEFIKKKL
jgi:predicted transcriptional regulator